MSFLTKIKNAIVGDIAEIYEINHGSEQYNYTNLDYDFNFANNLYKAKTISRSNIKRDENVFAGELNFTLPKTDEVAQIFKQNLNLPVFFRLFKIDKNDPNEEKVMIYTGYINSAKTDEETTEFTCNTNDFFTEKEMLRYRYGTLCQNDVYDFKCGLNEDDFSYNASIVDIRDNGTVIEVDTLNGAPTSNFFDNGYIKGENYSSTIVNHNNLVMTLYHPYKSAKIGDNIKLVAGCNRTSSECKNKFNNFENFFGFEYIPDQNPMRMSNIR